MFVFRIIPFLLILKYFVVATHLETTLNKNEIKLNETAVKANTSTTNPDNNSNHNKTEVMVTAPIIGEGGERLSTETAKTVASTTAKTPIIAIIATTKSPVIHGREGVVMDVEKKIDKNVGTNLTDANQLNNKTNIVQNNNNNTKTGIIAPGDGLIVENTSDKKHGSVPKKGVTFTDEQLNLTKAGTSSSTTTTTTTTATPTTTSTVKPSTKQTTISSTIQSTTVIKQIHKPTITTGSESDKDALVKEKSNNSTPKVPTIEYYQKQKDENKRSAFVIPIVAVIFSVPLVAIIANILYKHGKEWWSHRHYRRMDFLIDGMYNN